MSLLAPLAPGDRPINRNDLWCRVIVGALVDGGVTHALLCPGGRAAMMSMTLGRAPAIVSRLHVDERSAAFLALGLIAASGTPAVVCTTSGSAVANLLPAAIEADARNLPLILLTCDRPRRTRGTNEPQSTDQVGICRPLMRAQVDLPDPLDPALAPGELRRVVLDLVNTARHGQPPGPVHINVPQNGLLCSTEEDPDWESPAPPAESLMPPAPAAPAAHSTIADIEAALARVAPRPGMKSLILVGPYAPVTAPQLQILAEATGAPVIADAASGLRQQQIAGMVSCGDAIVLAADPNLAEAEMLVWIGDTPVFATMQRAVAALSCPVLRIVAEETKPDFLQPHCVVIRPPSTAGFRRLGELLGRGDQGWLLRWLSAEIKASLRRAALIDAMPWGEIKAAGIICRAQQFDVVHFANSLSIRHANLLCDPNPRAQRMFCNRGVNGIDGTLGTFLGEMLCVGGRGLVLLGDQAMVHDLPALSNPAWGSVHGTICVLNNGGGGVFDLIACRRLADYDKVMRNPPQADFAGIASAFGFAFRRCENRDQLEAALGDALCSDVPMILDVVVPPGSVIEGMSDLLRGMLAP